MKRKIAIALALVVGISIFAGLLKATTALYDETVRIVDSTGTVIGGTASATTANYNKTVRVVDSSGNVLDNISGIAGPTGATGATGPTGPVVGNAIASTLATTATTMFFAVDGASTATATEVNAELPWPTTETITQIHCFLTAASGTSGHSHAFTLIDVSSACATPPTCTASNVATCSATGKTCAITAGDLVVMSDVTNNTANAANGACSVSP